MSDQVQEKSPNLDLALIGNCRAASLVDRHARIVRWCFLRFHSDLVFSRLIVGDEEKGFCEVALADLFDSDAKYLRNTAVVETILTNAYGPQVRVTDFAPRLDRYERTFRPQQSLRRIEPLHGPPRIAIKVRPTCNYGRAIDELVVGSNHIRYLGGAEVMRLTTDAPPFYITSEIDFVLTQPVNLIFGQDDPFRNAIDETSHECPDRTREHWLGWVRHLGAPFEWQSAVVRAAITLKLCTAKNPAPSLPPTRLRSRRRHRRKAVGIIATAGCETRFSSSTRRTIWARPTRCNPTSTISPSSPLLV